MREVSSIAHEIHARSRLREDMLAAVEHALLEREEVLALIRRLAVLAQRVHDFSKPSISPPKGRSRPLQPVPRPVCGVEQHRASLAVLCASLRVATLNVVEAVQAWQQTMPRLLSYQSNSLGGPSVRVAPCMVAFGQTKGRRSNPER